MSDVDLKSFINGDKELLAHVTESTDSSSSIYLTQCRVYVAGVLMPTISVEIRSTYSEMPTAAITLPAYSELLFLGEMDRIPVHVFVRETMVESPNFILMFEGFITDKTYVNSALQRTVTFEAISHFDILDDAQLKVMSEVQDFYTMNTGGETDMALRTFVLENNFPHMLFSNGLNTGDQSEIIKFPIDYLSNIYKFIELGGKPDESSSSGDGEQGQQKYGGPLNKSALATYFAKQIKMLKFSKRFERLPYFDKEGADEKKPFAWNVSKYDDQSGQLATMFPILYGMQSSTALKQVSNGAENAAERFSMMELLTFLVEEMEYEFLVLTNPAFHGATQQEMKKGKELGDKASDERKAGQYEQADKTQKESDNEMGGKLISTALKPLFNETYPPQCNIVFRPLAVSMSMNLKHKGVPTRVHVEKPFHPFMIMNQGEGESALARAGIVDYYPSQKYRTFEVGDNAQKYFNFMSDEMLESESHTGPWIREVGTPRWFHYINHEDVTGRQWGEPIMNNGKEYPADKVFGERFCRRQLLAGKYLERQLGVETLFDPYITPGFPGVVFDSGDSGFAFAGHVNSVIHTITPDNVSTQVAMNFVRPLYEAANIEIPHPLTSIHVVTHDVAKLTEIYQAMLGTPAQDSPYDPEKPEEERKEGVGPSDSLMFDAIPGAKAISFEQLQKDYITTSRTNNSSPNSNPREAYKIKRRNICTFEQYCSFMNLGVDYRPGPEGELTPMELFDMDESSPYLTDRKPIELYRTSSRPLADPTLPPQEVIVDTELDQEQKEVVGESKADEESRKNFVGPPISKNANTGFEDGGGEGGEQQEEQAPPPKTTSELLEENAAKKRSETQTEAITAQKSRYVDVRKLLINVANREFAKVIYK